MLHECNALGGSFFHGRKYSKCKNNGTWDKQHLGASKCSNGNSYKPEKCVPHLSHCGTPRLP